ncbi:MAG: type II toxin-antitoxin system PemK/MazF family toxin [Bacteroidetes bacterium]|nr:MAG: type II toxin-antitoxin system PemK/MazF family toxin [Bacteroidota bacterium]
MKTGDIVLIPFPFSDSPNKKVRPAVVIAVTKDKHEDLVLSAISSVLPKKLSSREILMRHSNTNKLRVDSIIKVDRIVTLNKEEKIADLCKLNKIELDEYKSIFRELVD